MTRDNDQSNATSQPKSMMARLAVGMVHAAALMMRMLVQGAQIFWRYARTPLAFAANVLLALIVLFEEWGWKPLSDALGRLAKFRIFARIETLIAGLPPYAALVVFALPTLTLLPLKFVAMWLLAGGHYASATALFISAKIASTALVARIFTLTKPALMRLAWFATAYGKFEVWKDYLFAHIRASWVWRYGRVVKTRAKQIAVRAWTAAKPQALAMWQRLTGRLSRRAG